MIPEILRRLTKVESETALPAMGKHLVFQVEAPRETATGEIVAFLRERGHAIHDDDSVLVMNLAAHQHDGCAPLRDLSPDLMSEEVRDRAGTAWAFPAGVPSSFTFSLASPGGDR